MVGVGSNMRRVLKKYHSLGGDLLSQTLSENEGN